MAWRDSLGEQLGTERASDWCLSDLSRHSERWPYLRPSTARHDDPDLLRAAARLAI